MRVAPHHHPCQRCGVKTECPGTWEENYDGIPAVICPEWERYGGTQDFLCEACAELAAAEYAADLAEQDKDDNDNAGRVASPAEEQQ